MRRLLLTTLVLAVLAVLTGCSFGPSGDALGLEGEYVGTVKADISGAVTNFSGGQSQNVSVDAIRDFRGILTLERGYGDIDAVLSGLGCPALLKANGQQLTLMEDAECETFSEQTMKAGAQSTNTETTETTTVTEVTVIANGAGSIKVEATVEYESEERQNDQRTQTVSLDQELKFTGTLIAGE